MFEAFAEHDLIISQLRLSNYLLENLLQTKFIIVPNDWTCICEEDKTVAEYSNLEDQILANDRGI